MSPAEPTGEARMIAAVDIDGVLADVRHRLHHVRARPQDWDAFFTAARADPPLQQGIDTVRALAEVYEVVYLSGRPERCRDDTLAWFARHDLPPGRLLLRRAGDRRPARLVKVEALDRLSSRSRVGVLVDDDPLVIAAAREAGYDVLPATWMSTDEEAAEDLLRAQEVEGET